MELFVNKAEFLHMKRIQLETIKADPAVLHY